MLKIKAGNKNVYSVNIFVSRLFLPKSASDKLNYASVHRLHCDLKFLSRIEFFRHWDAHPLERMFRNDDLHLRFVVGEVRCDQKRMIFEIAEEDEVSVLVKSV